MHKMEVSCRKHNTANILQLPPELLQAILLDVPNKFTLRLTCKAFSNALRSCCGTLLLKYEGLTRRGPRMEVLDALSAFPNAGRVVLCLGRGHAQRFPYSIAQGVEDNGFSTDSQLITDSLDALRGRKLWSVSLLNLTHPLPSLSALLHHQATLVELELSDMSYSYAVDQGAFNALLKLPDACSCSNAFLDLALSFPRLRRLSLASAAFRPESVSALSKLTQLESLSLTGSLDCPGGVQQAAATYRTLLRGLTSIRELRMPMAVASRGAALFDDDDEEDASWGGQGEALHWHLASGGSSSSISSSEGSGDSSSGFSGLAWAMSATPLASDANWVHAMPGPFFSPPQTRPQPPAASATTFAKTLFGPLLDVSARHHATATPSVNASCSNISTVTAELWAHPKSPPVGYTAAVHAAGSLRRQKRQQQEAELAEGIVFPPTLQHLTIPLCSLNRPAFEALYAAYAGIDEAFESQVAGAEVDAARGAVVLLQQQLCDLSSWSQRTACSSRACSGCGGLNSKPHASLRIACDQKQGIARPGSTAYIGSQNPVTLGCAANGDAAAGSSRSSEDYCPSHQIETGDAEAEAGAGSVRPAIVECGHSQCGKLPPGSSLLGLRSLHIPTLAGYSHWEGGFLAGVEDFRKLARLQSLEVLHVSVETDAPGIRQNNWRGCFQQLRALPALRELRISEAQRPVCFSWRKRAFGRGSGADPFRSASQRALSDVTLEQLQQQWPRLQSLQVFSETVVRSGGRLVMPCGLDGVGMLPPQCPCCSGPSLMGEKPGAAAGAGWRASASSPGGCASP